MNTLVSPPFPYAGEVAALATALAWTATAVFGDIAVRRVGSLAVNLLRLVSASLAFSLYGAIARGWPLPLDASAHNWLWLVLSGLVGFMVCDLCLFKAFGYIGARLSMLLMSLAPPIAAVAALLIGQEMSLAGWIGMFVTLAGVTWVAMERRPAGVEADSTHRLRGVVLCVVAAVGQGTGVVMTRYGMDTYDPFAATQIRVLTGMVGFAVLVVASGWCGKVVEALRDRKAMMLIVANSLLGTFAGVTLQLISMKYIPAGVTSTLCSIVPVTIIPLAVLIQKERVSPRAIFGACVAVAGIAILMWPKGP